MTKTVHIFGGGTVSHVAKHLALCAPAYGTTARQLGEMCQETMPHMLTQVHLTRMAGGTEIETSDDLRLALERAVADLTTRVIILNAAVVDFDAARPDLIPPLPTKAVKEAPRWRLSSNQQYPLTLVPAPKLAQLVRATRKDIFFVAFKTTAGATYEEMQEAGMRLLKSASANLVFVNDVVERRQLIVVPEGATYGVVESRSAMSLSREQALKLLVKMISHRINLTFTRSTVVDGSPVPWTSPLVPDSFRKVLEWSIAEGAYRVDPTSKATPGHFAVKLQDTEFLTSIRKADFNRIHEVGLVRVVTDGPDTVLAYGAKPSVGGQSQRAVFGQHAGFDCIWHAHVHRKPSSPVPVISQLEYECGSHQCGERTATHLKAFGDDILAVMLDNHGPNVVFKSSADPDKVIAFIRENFDLSRPPVSVLH